MNVLLDGREVKVGDTLYDLAHGRVEVEAIDINDVEMPILARDSSGVTWWYYTDGRMKKESPRILYWDNPEIVPPSPPKRIDKKWNQNRIIAYITNLFHQITLEELTMEEVTIDTSNDISTGKQIIIKLRLQESQSRLTITNREKDNE